MTLRRRTYLFEATFNLDRDVDLIYKAAGFDKIVKAVKSKNRGKMLSALGQVRIDRPIWKSDTSKLRTRIARKAHKLNPVPLQAGVFREGSYYSPNRKQLSFSFNHNAFYLLIDLAYNAASIIQTLGVRSESFWNEFSEKVIKSTIYHELAHWVDDTMHNQYIGKTLARAREAIAGGDTSMSAVKGGYSQVTHTPMEVNAQIHALKNIRKQMGKRAYDKMTWKELFVAKPSLTSNFQQFKNEADYNSMMRRFVKRLNREGLLGKALRKIPSYEGLGRIFRKIGLS